MRADATAVRVPGQHPTKHDHSSHHRADYLFPFRLNLIFDFISLGLLRSPVFLSERPAKIYVFVFPAVALVSRVIGFSFALNYYGHFSRVSLPDKDRRI